MALLALLDSGFDLTVAFLHDLDDCFSFEIGHVEVVSVFTALFIIVLVVEALVKAHLLEALAQLLRG